MLPFRCICVLFPFRCICVFPILFTVECGLFRDTFNDNFLANKQRQSSRNKSSVSDPFRQTFFDYKKFVDMAKYQKYENIRYGQISQQQQHTVVVRSKNRSHLCSVRVVAECGSATTFSELRIRVGVFEPLLVLVDRHLQTPKQSNDVSIRNVIASQFSTSQPASRVLFDDGQQPKRFNVVVRPTVR